MQKYIFTFLLCFGMVTFALAEEILLTKQIENFKVKIKNEPAKKKFLQLNLATLFLSNKQYPEAFLILNELKKQKTHPLQDYIVFYWAQAHYEMGIRLVENKKYKESMPVFKKGRDTFLLMYDLFPESILLNKISESIGMVDRVIADSLVLQKQFKKAHLKYIESLNRIKNNELLKDIRFKLLEVHEKLSEWKKVYNLAFILLKEFPNDEHVKEKLRLSKEKLKLQVIESDQDSVENSEVIEEPKPVFGDELEFNRLTMYLKNLQYDEAFSGFIEFLDQFPGSRFRYEVETKIQEMVLRYMNERNSPGGQVKTYFKSSDTERKISKITPSILYKLGMSIWNKHYNDDAKKLFLEIYDRHKEFSNYSNVCYFLGRLYEDEQSYEKAQKMYATVIEKYSGATLYKDAFFKQGWIYLIDKKYAFAIESFSKLLSQFPLVKEIGTTFASKVLYWLSITYEKNQDRVNSKKYNDQLMNLYPLSFYAILMREKNNQSYQNYLSSLSKAKIEFVVPELITPQVETRLKKAEGLISAELFDEAKKELTGVKGNGDTEFLFYLSYVHSKAKNSKKGMELARLGVGFNLDILSDKVIRILFPNEYEEVAKTYKTSDIDPYLVLAIIRQESAFDREAVSRAGAKGLMQLIPVTAKSLDNGNSKQKFDSTVLFEPEVNIKFGVIYFKTLMKKFNNNIIMSLAAYNAGEIKVGSWMKYKTMPSDPIEFIEAIPFYETREYVKSVLFNYVTYKSLYEGVDVKLMDVLKK